MGKSATLPAARCSETPGARCRAAARAPRVCSSLRLGHEVVLLDSSDQMLRIARQDADAWNVTPRISFCHADTGQLRELFAAESFGVVVCHNLLEYSEVPSTTVRDMAHVLRNDGVLSILVRNRAGEVLKDAAKSGDWKLATANLTAETVVDTLYGNRMRLFAPADLHEMLAGTGLEMVAEHGVRVFFDYLAQQNPTNELTRKYSSWNRNWERVLISWRSRATFR